MMPARKVGVGTKLGRGTANLLNMGTLVGETRAGRGAGVGVGEDTGGSVGERRG